MVKIAKRLISILMAVFIMAGISVTGFAADGEKALQFGSDGKFSIMHITDTHLERVEKMIGEALKDKTKIFKL